MKPAQYIAPRTLMINGSHSPCDCSDERTCCYCMQAHLLRLETRFKAEENTANSVMAYIKKQGVKRIATELGVQVSNVRQWLKAKNLPASVVERYAEYVS